MGSVLAARGETSLRTVRAEPVEALLVSKVAGVGFDKLSPNG